MWVAGESEHGRGEAWVGGGPWECEEEGRARQELARGCGRIPCPAVLGVGDELQKRVYLVVVTGLCPLCVL